MESESSDNVILAPKSPWGWFPVVASSFLGTFVAGGIIVGLNWQRMGKNNLVLPTIMLSTIGWIIVQEYWPLLFSESSISTIVGYLLNIFVAAAFWLWQRETYLEWKRKNSEVQRAGWLGPIAAIIISTTLYLFLLTI